MKSLIFSAILLLTACHERRPAAPTAEQSDQLNDAEGMLDNMGQNEEGPETNASGPSNASD